MSNLKAEASKAVFGDGAPDEAIATAIENSSASQLKNIKEVMGIVRERAEMDGRAPRREVEAMQTLIGAGAHSVIAKAVEQYDEAPDTETLAQFAKDAYASDILAIMYPVKGGEDTNPRYMQSMVRGETGKELEHVMRAVKTASEMGSKGESMMDSFRMNIRVAETCGKHADIIPAGMRLEYVERLMMDLSNLKYISMQQDRFDTFGAHLKAAHQFEPLPVEAGSTDYSRGNYIGCDELVDAVEMYPDHVDELMAYRRERQTEDFDNDLFRDYLGGGALREGML